MLKLSTTKTVLAVLHLNNKEANRAWVRFNHLHTSVRCFHSYLHKWVMAFSVAPESGTEEQTVNHVII